MGEASLIEKIIWLLSQGITIKWEKLNPTSIWVRQGYLPNPILGTQATHYKQTEIVLFTNQPIEDALKAVDKAIQIQHDFIKYLKSLEDDKDMVVLQEEVNKAILKQL